MISLKMIITTKVITAHPWQSDRVSFDQAGIQDEEYVVNWNRTDKVEHEPEKKGYDIDVGGK